MEISDWALLLTSRSLISNLKALQLAKQVQSLQPGSPTGLVLEGDILMAQQRYADATKTYEKAFAKSQTSPIVVKLH